MNVVAAVSAAFSNPTSVLCAVVLITAFAAPRTTEVDFDRNGHAFVVRNGVLLQRGAAFSGRTIERYADGTRKRETGYRNGKLDGITRAWFANGQLDYARTYRVGLEEGVHRGWYENGSRRFEYHYANGTADGLSLQWYENGRDYTRFHFAKGFEEGQQQMWSPDGTLRANYVIRNGRRYGLPGSVGCRGQS